VLDYLSGRLSVAMPEFLAHGEHENGWRYVLMSQLPGTEVSLTCVTPSLATRLIP
jgi:hygromycin-B 7''-O-kinase